MKRGRRRRRILQGMAAFGQCSAVQSGVARLLVQFLEALVVLYYLCTLRYVIDDAYVTSDLSVDFGTRRSDSVVSLRDLCVRNSAC